MSEASRAQTAVIKSMMDLRRHDGQPARIEGRYEVSPVVGSKRLQPVVIVLDDGTRLLRAYRPRSEEFCFLERRVHLYGRAGTSSGQDPNVQQVEAPQILEVERLALAPGETPVDPVPAQLPSPPRAACAAELRARLERWVRVVGVLERFEELEGESFWGRAHIRLEDGTAVTRKPVPGSRWRDLEGQLISTLGRVLERDGAFTLVDLAAVWEGDDEAGGQEPG